jgi:hypothetical protein
MKTDTSEGKVSSLKRGLVTAASASVVVLRLPVASLTGFEPDSWRRTVGLGLRSDGTKFGLSTFGLDLFANVPEQERPAPTREKAEAHFARRWAEFVLGEPEARWVLRHRKHYVERVPGKGEVVIARFSEDGELQKIESVVEQPNASPSEHEERRKTEEAFCAAHRATRDMPERERPRALQRAAENAMAETGDCPLDAKSRSVRRISAASQVSFEIMPESAERFLPPDFRFRRPTGCGVFNIVARLAKDFRSVDVWLQIHHVATDGAPVQEMLGRLEKSWGVIDTPLFPEDNPAKAPRLISVQPSARDRCLCEVVDFVNFAPLLACREAINRRYHERLGGPAPVVCILLWQLARQPEFAGRKFSTAVDVPAAPPRARAVAMAGICPADYYPKADGFVDFARDYLQLLEKARARSTEGWRLMRQLALLPPWLAATALTVDAARGRQIFGTVGVSMLKDARVFSAPMEDAGWYEGFLAIGNLSLPSCGGGTVAAINARGGAETVRQYPGAIRRAIQLCSETV